MVVLRLIAPLVLIGMIVIGCSAEKTDENITGVATGWAGTWIDSTGTLVLTEDGMNVTGAYIDPETVVSEIIKGTISPDGKTLSGSWSTPGQFIFSLSDDGTYFNGTYGNGMNNTIKGADDSWNGTLTTMADAQNPWSGTWTSGRNDTTTLSQNAKTVNGTYEKRDTTDFSTIIGTVSEDGKTLAGTWADTGRFTLTLPDNGMYFNGTFGYNEMDRIEGIKDNWNGVRSK